MLVIRSDPLSDDKSRSKDTLRALKIATVSKVNSLLNGKVANMSQFKITKIFNTPQEACAALNVEFDPSGLSSQRWFPLNIVDDPYGYGDARVRMFSNSSGGCVMNWKTRQAALWFDNYRAGEKMTLDQRKCLRYIRNLSQRDHLVRQKEDYLEAAKVAKQIWLASTPATTHPYLETKHVLPTPTLRTIAYDKALEFLSSLCKRRCQRIYGSKQWFESDDLLVVPLRGDVAKIQSIQLIDSRGSKYFLKHAKKRGAYWMTQKPPEFAETIGIAEGVATALTVSQQMSIPVVAAMDCGNLMDVAISIQKRFPYAKIQVFGDVGNGEEEARDAAQAVCGTCSFPEFDDDVIERFYCLTGSYNPTDFNDYFMAVGEI